MGSPPLPIYLSPLPVAITARYLSRGLLLLLGFLLLNPLLGRAATSADLATLKARVRADDIASRASSASTVASWKNSQQSTGKWLDIDYTDKSRTAWQPTSHLQRLVALAVAYLTPGTAEYGSAAVRLGISNGVNYWYSSNPVSDNWWYNDIGAPRELGVLLLLMQSELTASQVTTGLSQLADAPSMTGQNKVWLSAITLYRALLENNLTRAVSGMDGIKSVVVVTSDEGIQPDYSFHQHGAQLYSGGYGQVLVNDVVRWIFLGDNTGFAFSAATEKVMADFMLEGSGWMIRQELMDFSTMGRSISRTGVSDDGRGLLSSYQRMASLGGTNGPRFQTVADHIQKLGPGFSGNRHFWCSDFMVHRREAYYASVKMASTRTIGSESLNSENLKGIYLPFGTQFILRRGDEYNDIFPVWNWLRLPGTTLEQTAAVPAFSGSYQAGTTTFVGGVSSGKHGLAALDHNFKNVRAHKSWFFFEDGFLALGAGIACSTTNSVFTTLNQTRLTGPVLTGNNGTFSEVAAGDRTLTNINWVYHDGIGYVLPTRPALRLRNLAQTGTWKSINDQYSADLVTQNVFTLGLDHGATPTSASYEYAVLPGFSSAAVAAFAADNPVTVLANTNNLQAARHKGQRLAAASFFTAGKVLLRPGLQVIVDQPCLVLLQEGDDSYEISVSNPRNAALSVRMTISAQFTANPDATWLPAQRMTEVVFALPGGDSAGSTVTKQLALQPQTPTHLPSAAISTSTLEGFAPWSIDFDGSASLARGSATLTSYRWDFGDGATSIGPVASHSYSTPGVYRALLTVTDSRGATATAHALVEIRNGLLPAADTYVRAGSYAANTFGTVTSLVVKEGAENDYTRRSYLRFDLSKYSGTLSRAILRLVVTSVDSSLIPPATVPFSVYHVPTDTWSEATLNWNNRPARTAGARATAQVGAVGQVIDLDLTSTVQQELAGDKVLSLQLTQESGDTYLTLGSREHPTAAPTLLIETTGGNIVANAGAGSTLTLPKNRVSLKGTVTGTGLTSVAWSQEGGPPGVEFTAPAALNSEVIFSQPGTYLLRLHASDGRTFSHSDITFTVWAQTPASWSTYWFGSSGNLARDSDGDGLSDALEFALGGNPLVTDAPRVQPQVDWTGSVNRQGTLHYRKNDPQVVYLVEWSSALGTSWSTAGVSAEQFDNDSGTYSRSVTVPAGTGKFFLRLRAQLP